MINSALPTPTPARIPPPRAALARGTVLTAAPAAVVTIAPLVRAIVVPAARPGMKGGMMGCAEAVTRHTARVKAYKP